MINGPISPPNSPTEYQQLFSEIKEAFSPLGWHVARNTGIDQYGRSVYLFKFFENKVVSPSER